MKVKFKIYLYRIIRISFGVLLVLNSMYNAIKYPNFLNRLDNYFDQVTVFKYDIIETFAPLVPFEEFVIGFFLILGMFLKKVLKASTLLFAFFTLFLFDANNIYCALTYLMLFIVSVVLLRKNNYDLSSVDSYKVLS